MKRKHKGKVVNRKQYQIKILERIRHLKKLSDEYVNQLISVMETIDNAISGFIAGNLRNEKPWYRQNERW